MENEIRRHKYQVSRELYCYSSVGSTLIYGESSPTKIHTAIFRFPHNLPASKRFSAFSSALPIGKLSQYVRFVDQLHRNFLADYNSLISIPAFREGAKCNETATRMILISDYLMLKYSNVISDHWSLCFILGHRIQIISSKQQKHPSLEVSKICKQLLSASNGLFTGVFLTINAISFSPEVQYQKNQLSACYFPSLALARTSNYCLKCAFHRQRVGWCPWTVKSGNLTTFK